MRSPSVLADNPLLAGIHVNDPVSATDDAIVIRNVGTPATSWYRSIFTGPEPVLPNVDHVNLMRLVQRPVHV